MLSWEDFEKECIKKNIYTINNKSSKNIVFFGNCTIAPIGFFLNHLTNKQYNIHIIISWLFEKKGFEKFDMQKINSKIQELLNSADVLIYHNHHKDYGVKATKIQNLCNKKTNILVIPNLHFCFDAQNSDLFYESLWKLKTNITLRSDFKEFEFIYSHYKNIRFFNTSVHPTHYLLFLLAKSIKYKIIQEKENQEIKIMNIQSYYDEKNKNQFKNIKEVVVLPGFTPITKVIQQHTGILENADYFDY